MAGLGSKARSLQTCLTRRRRPPTLDRANFFWHYISESHLKDLMERLAHLLAPSELERYGVLALANVHMAECSETLRSRPVQTHDPMEIDSYARKRHKSRTLTTNTPEHCRSRSPPGPEPKHLVSTNTLPASDSYAAQNVASNTPKPLAGSDQKTQIEQRREVPQDAGVLSVRTPTGAGPQAPLPATNSLPVINPFATQFGTKNGPQPLTRSNHKTEIEQL